MRNIYLAARYGRLREMQEIATRLEADGHRIASSWINGEHEAKDGAPSSAEARAWAEDDLADISAADTFVFFCEEDRENQRGRGGRFVELGYAMALQEHGLLEVILVGRPEANIFTHIDGLVLVDDVDGLLAEISICEEVTA